MILFPAMKNAKGQEVQWVIPEDMLAWAKEKMSPENFAKIEAHLKPYFEEPKPKPPGLHARLVQSSEIFTDPWTGGPKVFTEEEKAKYGPKYGIRFK